MNYELDKRWGILYCPKKGIRTDRKRWSKIRQALDACNVQYDFVQSESSDSVERLMRMLINNGYKTIVIVGGDSALNDAVNCMMEVDSTVREEIALGVIPNGVMNDFARYWDFKESEIQQTVEWLVKHRVRKVDLGCIHYVKESGEASSRYFLNCVNIGLIADIMNQRRQARSLLGSRTLAFFASIVTMAFHRWDYKMRLRIGYDVIERRVMTVCVGSGPGYGQTPNAVPYNGMLDVSVVYQPQLKQLFAGLWLLITGRFLNHKSVHPFRTREMQVTEAGHARVGIDGRLLGKLDGPYSFSVEMEAINFLIPA
ncbi:MAG: lipid kinase [Prevotella sp.]|nr:lipid kinase [Prevotella sp.]